MNRALCAIAALLAGAGGALAHDYWLVPETFTPKKGEEVKVRMFVGDGFEAEKEIEYSSKKTTALELITAKAKVKEFPDLKDGTKPAVSFKMDTKSTAVLRIDRGWSSITLKADKFTEYLKEEGLDHIIKARAEAGEADADGKERYRRCLKAILHAGGEPPTPGCFDFWLRQSHRAEDRTDDTPTKPVGQLLEIVPGKNPYSLKVGDELPVRVL